MDNAIRAALAQYGKLAVDASALGREDDLFAKGFTSNATVNVMLALEDEYDVEFAESDLKKSTFATIASIEAVLQRLVAA